MPELQSTADDRSGEDEGFMTTIPDRPGYRAWGRTAEEAAVRIADTQAAWIEACEATGEPATTEWRCHADSLMRHHDHAFIEAVDNAIHSKGPRPLDGGFTQWCNHP
jgi:predicted RNase H-like HicB family nuclease